MLLANFSLWGEFSLKRIPNGKEGYVEAQTKSAVGASSLGPSPPTLAETDDAKVEGPRSAQHKPLLPHSLEEKTDKGGRDTGGETQTL